MKKALLIAIGVFCLASMARAQDILTTKGGEDIQVKILEVTSSKVKYKLFDNLKGPVFALSKSEVLNIRYENGENEDFSLSKKAAESLPAQTVVTSDTSVETRIPSLRIAVQGGVGYRLAKVESGLDQVVSDHYKKMKWGMLYGADVTWFFAGTMGVGVKCTDLRSSHSVQVTATNKQDGTSRSGTLSDRTDIWFLGPILSYRQTSLSGRHTVFLNYGLGYMGYRNDARMIDPYSMRGGTLGTLMDVGYDFGVTDRLAIGAVLSMQAGTLSSYRLTMDGVTQTVNLDKDEREGLGHLQLAVGLRWYL